MNFGVFLTTAQLPNVAEDEVFDNAIVYTQEAERLGFDAVWLLEHHFTKFGLCSDTLVMAGFLLGRTTTLRVGTAVTVLPLYHPVHLAESVALIDRLSGGRLDFGIGRGRFTKDFEVFGVDPTRNHLITQEWAEIIERAWCDDAVEHDSELVKFPAVPVYPTPTSRGGPPMLVVCESTVTTQWAASRGYPMILSWWLEEEAIVSQIELYNDVSAAHGHDPETIEHVLSSIAFVADTTEEAIAAVRPNLMWWRDVGAGASFKHTELRKMANYKEQLRRWEDHLIASGGDPAKVENHAVDRLIALNPIGSPEHCIARLQQLVDATGVTRIACGFEGPGRQEAVVESMRRFAAEVMPNVHAPTTAPVRV